MLPVKKLMVLGDVHAVPGWFRFVCREAKRQNVDAILQVGDFGFWPGDKQGKSFLAEVDRLLERHGQHCFFIDGNHEEHPALNTLKRNSEGFAPISERLTYVPRGTRWTWSNVRFAAIGGAASVDKDWRVEGVDWFPEEVISSLDVEMLVAGGKADVLVSHDAPMGAKMHLELQDDAASNLNRERLQEIVEAVKPLVLYHGHYHHRQTELITLNSGEVVRVESLDRDSTMMKAYQIIDLTTLL